MWRIVLWALATGFVTGAVWFAILFFRRHPVPTREPSALPAPQDDQLSAAEMQRRLLELEERLDATEHVLMRDQVDRLRDRSK
jgi:hypothetical protein